MDIGYEESKLERLTSEGIEAWMSDVMDSYREIRKQILGTAASN
jgi:esterase/lipase